MFFSPKLSLSDMLTPDYTHAVAKAQMSIGCKTEQDGKKTADEKVDFYSEAKQRKNDELLKKVGTYIAQPFSDDNNGAPTNSFKKAQHNTSAPLTGTGCFRVGEDGRLYLLGKSEHYHTSLGHGFPGYQLIDLARNLGILNATHNNTRGFITRLTEKQLVADINGIDINDKKAMDELLSANKHKALNRVINLETGSIACEAGMKMMLERFYKLDGTYDAPKYNGKTPVFFVMADNYTGLEANYHGTSVLAQSFRGMWPEYYKKIEEIGIYKVVSVLPNDIGDFKEKIVEYNTGNYKTAGFIHEIILMNYGGIRLTEEYLQAAYKLCEDYDTPVMCDEIQSCMWYKGMFLFRCYDLKPDFVVIGKGFPGGEYPASKIITTGEMDTLNQFGALVTNGQEELASLAYLITMTFSKANGNEIEKLGAYFEENLRAIASGADAIVKVEGKGHLAAIHFDDLQKAEAFSNKLNERCIDASAQLYKKHCPPAVLLKPPIISSKAVMDYILDNIKEILGELK